MAVIGAHKFDLGMVTDFQHLSIVYNRTVDAGAVATQTPIQQDLQTR